MSKKSVLVTSLIAIALVATIVEAATVGPYPSVGLYWFDNVDPTTGAGMSAPANQLLVRTDTPSIYYKSGPADTAWTKIGNGAGGGGTGTVTSVACGTGMSCSPSPITTTGTVNVNLTPTTCAAGTAEITTAANGTSTCSTFVNAVGTGLSLSGSTASVNLTPTTCAAGMAEISTAADGTSACASFVTSSSLTANTIPKGTGAGALANSSSTDDGTTVTIGGQVTVVEASGNTTIPGFLAAAGQFVLSGTISPTAFAGTRVDNYNPTGLSTTYTIQQNVTSATTITGLTAQPAGTEINFRNTGASAALTFSNADTNSLAANRFSLPGGVNWILPAGSSLLLRYSSAGVWRLVASSTTDLPTLNVDSGFSVAGGSTLLHSATSVTSSFTASAGSTFTSGTGGIPITAGNNHSPITTGSEVIQVNETGVYDTTSGAITAYGIQAQATGNRTSGANPLTNVALYATATTAQTNQALVCDAGDVILNNTSGTTTVKGAASFTSTTSTTFSNGPTGFNTYGGTHLEWVDDWLVGVLQPTSALNWPLGTTWIASANASNLFTVGAGTTSRPGILEMTTSTSTTGQAEIVTSTKLVDFGSGNWSFEWAGGWPTLSVSGNFYASVIGFGNTTDVNPTNGCYFLYDQGNVASGGQNGSNTNDLEAVCANGGTRTIYLLNGSGNCDNSFAKGTVLVSALTLPNTNIVHLLVKMTAATKAEFYTVSGTVQTKVCEIATNIPSGASNLTGVVFDMIKSTGGTARTFDTDYTRIAVDLTSARSP